MRLRNLAWCAWGVIAPGVASAQGLVELRGDVRLVPPSISVAADAAGANLHVGDDDPCGAPLTRARIIGGVIGAVGITSYVLIQTARVHESVHDPLAYAWGASWGAVLGQLPVAIMFSRCREPLNPRAVDPSCPHVARGALNGALGGAFGGFLVGPIMALPAVALSMGHVNFDHVLMVSAAVGALIGAPLGVAADQRACDPL